MFRCKGEKEGVKVILSPNRDNPIKLDYDPFGSVIIKFYMTIYIIKKEPCFS